MRSVVGAAETPAQVRPYTVQVARWKAALRSSISGLFVYFAYRFAPLATRVWRSDPAFAVMLGSISALFVVGALWIAYLQLGRIVWPSSLTIDRDGLTYTVRRSRRVLPWREVRGFDLSTGRGGSRVTYVDGASGRRRALPGDWRIEPEALLARIRAAQPPSADSG